MRTVIISAFLLFSLCGPVPADDVISPPRRIISLSPATTEILFALGAGDRVVGVTSFCDLPPEARTRTKVGGMSNPSLETVLSLKPDLVVLTTDGNPREAEERLRSLKVPTYVWEERKLADLPAGIRKLAKAIGAIGRGEQLAGEIEQTLRGPKFKVQVSAGKKVLYIVWPEPLLVAGPGTAIHDAIMLLGLENIAGRAASSYPRYSLEEVIRDAPDVIFVGKGSGMDMQAVSQGILKKLGSVPAVRDHRVCYVSDRLYRLGPRVIAGIEELSACVK